MARLDRLGRAKEVAQIGATIGREFSHALLVAVVGSPAELEMLLDRLLQSGLLFTALGQEGGTALVKRGLAAFRATGVNLWVPFYLTLLPDAYRNEGKPLEALACLSDAIDLIEVTHERATEAEIHRLRGELFASLQDITAATGALQSALEVARRQQARLFELRAATSLARLWRDQGREIDARNLLAPIYGWFTEGLDSSVLQSAKSLLEELTPAAAAAR
jgi:predicted ATPase